MSYPNQSITHSSLFKPDNSGQLWESSNLEIQFELAEGRTLHIHADNNNKTEAWLNAIRTARNAGKSIEDQLLTKVKIATIPQGILGGQKHTPW